MKYCINCNMPASHMHHVVPKVLGGNDTTNVVPLCDKCHGLIHSVSYTDGKISHSELTKKGLQKARESGKQLGNKKGVKLETKKSKIAKEIIKANSKDFNGNKTDAEVIIMANISRNSFYKYKKELKGDMI